MRLLVQGSAHALPFRDESVQTVVTSPPYWGLRQYAGEQSFAWGGDSEHAHEWGTPVVKRRGTGGEREYGSSDGGVGRGPAVVLPESAFCACGAWHGALGLEPTPELYVAHMVEVFREVWRVLRPDGTLWLVIGDSYAGATTGADRPPEPGHTRENNGRVKTGLEGKHRRPSALGNGLKPKDLIGIPWRVAFALQADGWWLRSDIVYSKPNPMPESVTDRPTKSHEYVFLLTKSGSTTTWRHRDRRWVRWPERSPEPDWRWYDSANGDAERDTEPPHWRTAVVVGDDGKKRARWSRRNLWRGFDYFYDAEAIREPVKESSLARISQNGGRPKLAAARARREAGHVRRRDTLRPDQLVPENGRNARSVWEITTQAYRGAHFATFPEALVERCILVGSALGDVVLDPFNGSGTTGRVAIRHGRRYVGLDISREYLAEQATRRVDRIQHVMGGW